MLHTHTRSLFFLTMDDGNILKRRRFDQPTKIQEIDNSIDKRIVPVKYLTTQCQTNIDPSSIPHDQIERFRAWRRESVSKSMVYDVLLGNDIGPNSVMILQELAKMLIGDIIEGCIERKSVYGTITIRDIYEVTSRNDSTKTLVFD